MRIALVSLHTSPSAVPGRGDGGGLNVVVAAAAQALAQRGHDVVVATRASRGVVPGERALFAAHPDGPRLVAYEVGPLDAPKVDLPELLPAFADALRELGPCDAVHAHYWLSGLAALPLAADSGVAPAVTLHTVGAAKHERLAPGELPEPPLRLAAERALVARSGVVGVSAHELGAIRRLLGEPGFGAFVIPPGVDTDTFRPRAHPSVSRETPEHLRITVLGRVQPLKGQDLAVRAVIELARRDPDLWSHCELVIAGEPTAGAEAYADGLRTLARNGGIAERVRFLPAQDRAAAAQLLAESSVAVIPSHSETFGLVALEAAACGVPVVSGDHTGLVEAAPAAHGGVHVAGRDPVTWARALSRLLRDPALRSRIGARAMSHARRHDWDAHAARLERVYARLAAPSRGEGQPARNASSSSRAE